MPRNGINGQSPAQGSVCMLLRSKSAHKALVEHRRDDERVIRKTGFLDYPIGLGLAGKVGNIEPAAADRFYIGKGDQTKCLTPASLAARTAAVACLSSSVPSSQKLVTRK